MIRDPPMTIGLVMQNIAKHWHHRLIGKQRGIGNSEVMMKRL